jgi:hypothetical protein
MRRIDFEEDNLLNVRGTALLETNLGMVAPTCDECGKQNSVAEMGGQDESRYCRDCLKKALDLLGGP